MFKGLKTLLNGLGSVSRLGLFLSLGTIVIL
jgi:hypothetical protein